LSMSIFDTCEQIKMNRINQVCSHVVSNVADAARKTLENTGDKSLLQKKGNLKGKTVVVSGASRGIGLSIARRCAMDGANVVILAKTDTPHPKLPGTIYTAAAEMDKLGGKGLAIKCDIRFEDQAQKAIDLAVKTFGGIDILVNNASAIKMKTTDTMSMKEFDLIHSINVRGTFMMSKLCLPHLQKSSNGHVLIMSPPIIGTMHADYIASSPGYITSKIEMSMIAMGLSAEFKEHGVAVNSLWPRTTIATAAVQYELGGDAMMKASRTEEIQSDSAYEILTTDSRACTGHHFVDDDVLRTVGVTDFKKYRVDQNLREEDLIIII
jgi:citronellol/citronellal dehydrogenase